MGPSRVLEPWPQSIPELDSEQMRLAAAAPEAWLFDSGSPPPHVAACYVCFGRGGSGPGAAGDLGWAAASLAGPNRPPVVATATRKTAAGYHPGRLALREGPLLEAAVLALPELPELLLVDATGRDHPRGAGLALHLGARLGIPAVGVTNRLLVATGEWPEDTRGSTSPFRLEGKTVGYWIRTRSGVRPVAAHAAWRTDAATALAVVQTFSTRARTPEPLRIARRAAREARQASRPLEGG